MPQSPLDTFLSIFKAVGEETRLRIVVLLIYGELTVTELTQILGQSQPRVSRHLKILADAGLVERHREGAWIFYRFARVPLSVSNRVEDADPVAAIQAAISKIDPSTDRILARDTERFQQCRKARSKEAADYFRDNASNWDRIRSLHIPEDEIENTIRDLIDGQVVDFFVDIGVGTGRMLVTLANQYKSGIGYDTSPEMLAIARARLEKERIDHADVRLGDALALPIETGQADLVCIHHVLHYLSEPGEAVEEAARLLKPGGKLIISDFAPHDLEFLRKDHAHRRLGFSEEEAVGWANAASLQPVSSVSLSPRDASGPALTVKIWAFEMPRTVRRLHPYASTAV
ncbi:MAG: metalloregulator ArsR/SmtB family transcription factor [Pseudomonadota bacterium]